MQVLNTIYVLIDFNNSIDTLGSQLCYLSHLVAIFSSFVGQMPHYLQSDSNTMNPSRIRRCMIEPEEIWSKNAEEMREISGNFAGLQKFATCKFRNLRIFEGCEISQHCSHMLLTAFFPAFLWFYTSFPLM